MLTKEELDLYMLKKAEQIMGEKKLKTDKAVTDEKVKIQNSCKGKKDADKGGK